MRTYEKMFLFTAGTVFLVDRVTKAVSESFLSGRVGLIPGILELSLSYNTGGAFGLFKNAGWVLILAGFLAIWLIAYYYNRIILSKSTSLSTGLILGGAVGNLVDRLAFGRVADFIAFNFWPAFNLADSALTIGVALLMISSLKEAPRI